MRKSVVHMFNLKNARSVTIEKDFTVRSKESSVKRDKQSATRKW